jgi:hypothetical protein
MQSRACNDMTAGETAQSEFEVVKSAHVSRCIGARAHNNVLPLDRRSHRDNETLCDSPTESRDSISEEHWAMPKNCK